MEQIPDASDLKDYGAPPSMLHLDITAVVVDRWISDGAGPGEVDGRQLQPCPLCCGNASSELREAYTDMVSWLEKSSPPWDAYRVLMMWHLIDLDKQPGVRPYGPPPPPSNN